MCYYLNVQFQDQRDKNLRLYSLVTHSPIIMQPTYFAHIKTVFL